ncbi:MAG: VCBS repeat-containing protein [Myxococcales bacterium]|nr:VCBS repeat-containing protein [Myxococcales bacterium]
MRLKNLALAVTIALTAGTAQAVPFTITISNTGTNSSYPWSAGLLTLSPVISLGHSPQPSSAQYSSYVYANSHCNRTDGICGSGCNDDGNAAVLAARLGLTLGVDAWLVPALPAGSNATARVTIDAPVGSRLSYIAWINNTSVFDDFVSIHPPGMNTTLSVPLFDSGGSPLPAISFNISGYDTNSTSATDGSGATCAQECPTQTAGCYVAPGNASIGGAGLYPPQPPATPGLSLTASGPTSTSTSQVTYTFSYTNQSTSTVNNPSLTYTLPAGVTFVSASNGGTLSGSTVTWALGNQAAGATGSRTVTVNLGGLGGTTAHSGAVTWLQGARRFTVVSNVILTTLAAPQLTPVWVYTEPTLHTTDGLAVANFTNASGSEVLVLAPARGSSGPGRAVVLNSGSGAELSSFSPGTGRNVMGFPLAQQMTGSGQTLEYVFGEPLPVTSNAGVYARNGSSTGLWTSIPYGYSAYWNMGPASANLTGAQNNEIVIADWDGNVKLLQSNNGSVIASYSTWTSDQDHVFGHAAIADVDNNGALDVVLAGNKLGTVIALQGSNLTLRWKSAPLFSLYGDVPYGSGPAVGDLDGDGRPEIVVATRGTTSDVYAFDATQPTGSTCEYRFDPGGSHTYTSPVIGDVDGSGRKSVVVISSTTATLTVMKAGATGCAAGGGTIVWQHVIKAGDRSSFTPVLYDVTGDGVLDVIAASNTRLEVIDVRRRAVLLAYDDATAVFAPSAAIANASTGSAVRELYVSGWKNSKVYRFDLPSTATSTNDWPTFMGGNTRTGAR